MFYTQLSHAVLDNENTRQDRVIDLKAMSPKKLQKEWFRLIDFVRDNPDTPVGRRFTNWVNHFGKNAWMLPIDEIPIVMTNIEIPEAKDATCHPRQLGYNFSGEDGGVMADSFIRSALRVGEGEEMRNSFDIVDKEGNLIGRMNFFSLENGKVVVDFIPGEHLKAAIITMEDGRNEHHIVFDRTSPVISIDLTPRSDSK